MSIHESLALWCYHPLIGKKRLGHFYGGGEWAADYFARNRNHYQIIDHDLREKIKARFVNGRFLCFVRCFLEFDRDWNSFNFNYSVDSNMLYPMALSVVVYCPALTPQLCGGGLFR